MMGVVSVNPAVMRLASSLSANIVSITLISYFKISIMHCI